VASALTAPSAAGSAAEVSFPIPREVVDRVLNPGKLPAYDGPTGSVEGTITVIGPPSPDAKIDTSQCPAALDTYGKLFREGPPSTPDGPRPLGDAVVAVVGYNGFYVPEHEPAARLTIGPNCAYPARSVAITFGQRLEVGNQSKVPFAPMTSTETSPAVMMAAPFGAGDPVRIYPKEPGHSVLGDIMQTYVREDLYVLRFPLHAVSGTDGHYRIDGVPVGKLTLGAQHPTVASQASAPVEIVANVVQKVDLTLEYAPKAAKPVDTKAGPIFR
jgi:hypothetical protein